MGHRAPRPCRGRSSHRASRSVRLARVSRLGHGHLSLRNESAAEPCGSVPRRNRAWRRHFAKQRRATGRGRGNECGSAWTIWLAAAPGVASSPTCPSPSDRVTPFGDRAERRGQVEPARHPIGPPSARCRADHRSQMSGRQSLQECLHTVGHRDGLKSSLTAGENLLFAQRLLGAPRPRPATPRWSASASAMRTTCRWLTSRPASGGAWPSRRLLVCDRPLWLLDEPKCGLGYGLAGGARRADGRDIGPAAAS